VFSQNYCNFQFVQFEKQMDPIKFVDAIMDVITSENRSHAKGAQHALDILIDVSLKVNGGDKVLFHSQFNFSFSLLLLLCLWTLLAFLFDLCILCFPLFLKCDTRIYIYIQERASSLPVFDDLAERVYHCCFHKEWYFKAGGCCGITHLINHLSVSWVKKHQLEFIEALLYIIKVITCLHNLYSLNFV
jgi:transformation/transcription domain-associated protein